MPQLTITNRAGASARIEGQVGFTLMEAIRDAGFDELLAMCGGCLSCATCHVYVEDSALALPPQSEEEDDLLSDVVARQPNSRLSCQIPLSASLDGLRVTIAPAE
ncbi:2Fe-2S iron-sulfur cluster-binding protein [soil metagenome]